MAILKQAAATGRAVTVGQGPAPDGALRIDLSGYRRLVRVDRDNGAATVEAGIGLRSLAIELGAWGLSLENGGRDPAQALGAAVSLGAHGTGARFGGLATSVTALRLITPEGTVLVCSAADGPDVFDAARVGLGALGVISTVTLRCQRGFNLRVHRRTVELDEVLADFDQLADGNDHLELSWVPGRGQAKVTTANRTGEAADGAEVDRGYRWLNRRRIRGRAVEYSFPRHEAGPALQRAREASVRSRWAPLFPVVVSVTAGDDIPLSPAQGRPSIYIGGVLGLGGRPQWGTGEAPSAASLQALYPRFGEWQAVRDRLDPERRFAYTSGHG